MSTSFPLQDRQPERSQREHKSQWRLPPWDLTVWLVCQSGRPFGYRFSRAAAFQWAKELRQGIPSGDWSVEKRRAHLVVLEQDSASTTNTGVSDMGEKTSLSNLVEELRALEAKATKGKWIVEKEAIAGKVGISALHDNPKTRQFITWSMGAGPDADLIAAMRNALPTLLSALEGEKETEHDVEKAALAFAMYDGCGAQVNGTRVLCDDDRVSPEARVLNCICRRGMRKALAALKSPVKP